MTQSSKAVFERGDTPTLFFMMLIMLDIVLLGCFFSFPPVYLVDVSHTCWQISYNRHRVARGLRRSAYSRPYIAPIQLITLSFLPEKASRLVQTGTGVLLLLVLDII